MKKVFLFLFGLVPSFLFGDISQYVTSTDISSIEFERSQMHANLISKPVTEKMKIISSIEAIDKLGLDKIFVQNMTENNFGDDDLLLQVKMFEILRNFNPELANYFDIVAFEKRPQLTCIDEEMGMEQAAERKAEQAWLIRTLEKEFNRALEDLYLIKKEMDESKYLKFMSDISQFPSPFNEHRFWNYENIKNIFYQTLMDVNAVSPFVKPNQFLDISILEKPLSTYFFQNAELELIKISSPSNQHLTKDRQEKFSFSKILPYYYEDSDLETMKRQNTRLLENVLGTYSNYFEISDQIPLFNLEQEKEQINLTTGIESPDEFPDADCKKNFEYELRLQRDLALLKIRAEIFNEIKKYKREFDQGLITLQRRLIPLALSILDSIEVRIHSNNNHLYGYSDYQVLLSNLKRLREIVASRYTFDSLVVSVLQFLEKLSASKHQVKISNKNIIVNGEIISADILHIGDLSYFKSSNNQLYGYFHNGQWNILDQYESSVEKAFQAFENNKAPNFESIIIPVPSEYLNAVKEYFEPEDRDDVIRQQRYEDDVKDKFVSKVVLDQKYSYCGNLYEIARNSFNQNSIYGRQQRSNEFVIRMYKSLESRENFDHIKFSELVSKGYDFSDLDSISYLENTSNTSSAINRLANVAWSDSYMQRNGVMDEHYFARTITDICKYGEDFRKF